MVGFKPASFWLLTKTTYPQSNKLLGHILHWDKHFSVIQNHSNQTFNSLLFHSKMNSDVVSQKKYKLAKIQ